MCIRDSFIISGYICYTNGLNSSISVADVSTDDEEVEILSSSEINVATITAPSAEEETVSDDDTVIDEDKDESSDDQKSDDSDNEEESKE